METPPPIARQFHLIQLQRCYLKKAILQVNVPGLSEGQGCMRLVLKRGYDALFGVLRVAEAQLPVETGALARIVCEAALLAGWLAKDPEGRARQFFDEGVTRAAQMLKHWADYDHKGAKSELDRVMAEDLAARNRLGVSLTKSAKALLTSPSEFANEMGTNGRELYAFHYDQLSLSAHVTANSLEWGLEFSPQLLERNLFLASASAMPLIDRAGAVLKLPDSSDLKISFEAVSKLAGDAAIW